MLGCPEPGVVVLVEGGMAPALEFGALNTELQAMFGVPTTDELSA